MLESEQSIPTPIWLKRMVQLKMWDLHNVTITIILIFKVMLIEVGDSQNLVTHFKHMANQDGMLLRCADESNRMANFVWMDGRCRIDYD